MQDRKVFSGQIWRHYKGNLYTIICLARDESTEKEVVVYQKTKEDFFRTDELPWVRPLDNFLEVISSDEGTNFYRFELVYPNQLP